MEEKGYMEYHHSASGELDDLPYVILIYFIQVANNNSSSGITRYTFYNTARKAD